MCLSSPGSWHGAPVLGWALCTVEGQMNDRQISREQVWGLWAPGSGSHWNALCIWLWSRRPYCLASECSQQALFLSPLHQPFFGIYLQRSGRSLGGTTEMLRSDRRRTHTQLGAGTLGPEGQAWRQGLLRDGASPAAVPRPPPYTP